jgi:hypothetical protein
LPVRSQDFSSHSYRVIARSLSWHEARADAESRGGHLATITSQAELDHVLALGILPDSGSYWLGATDAASPGTWTWVTGEPWDYTRWAPGEPNSVGVENCLHSFGGPAHLWNNWGGNERLGMYLLEIEPEVCTPHKATATAVVVNGFVVGATVTDPGCGYTNAPAVRVEGGGGAGATARAVISNGVVSAIQMLNAGIGYTSQPFLRIASPPAVPRVDIAVSKVVVRQTVILGWSYVLEVSTNAVDWTPAGPPFVAESESVETEYPAGDGRRLFRLRVVP